MFWFQSSIFWHRWYSFSNVNILSMFVIKHRTSTKKKQTGIQFPRDDVNGPSGKCTCIFGPDFANRDRLICFHFPLRRCHRICFCVSFWVSLTLILSLSWKWTEEKWKTSCCQCYYFCNLLIEAFGIYNFRNSSWIPT
jgi:hypothetical protein